MKIKLLLLGFVLFAGIMANGQQRKISGTVTSSDNGDVLIGVSVVIKGTTHGTITDVNGTYTIDVPPNQDSLIFSYIGMKAQVLSIGNRSVVDAVLIPETIGVEEVVVTAFGISKEKKALGYAVSQVNADQLEQKPETDIARVLTGKAAGVKVTSTSGVSGTGTNIIIRGYSSIKGNNQPLFIVDGVRFSGSTNSGTDNEQGFLEGNQATSSRFLDIDPNNIENISVLKGLSATTVYGSEGRNGVIIITTKNGSQKNINQKMEVTVNQSYFLNKVNLPEFQNTYGCGFQQQNGFFYSNWGAKITDPAEVVAHPYSLFNDPDLIAAFPEYQNATYELKAYDNVNAFFRTGTISNTSVNISGGNEKSSFNANVGLVNEQGFLENNQLNKFTVGIGGSTKLTNKLVFNGTMNYVKTDMATPPISYGDGSGIGGGSGISVFADVLYTPRTIDLMGLPFESPIDHRSVYYRAGNDIQNPRWTTKYSKAIDNVHRLFGSGNLSYELPKNLKLTYKYGIDFYAEKQEYQLNKGSVQNDNYLNGLYRTREIFNTTWDQTIMLNYNAHLGSLFTMDAMIGGSSVRELYSADGMESTNQLVFGFMNHKNFSDHSTYNSFNDLPLQENSESNTLGLFGQATLSYNSYLYFNVSARNDWFSSLQPDNRSKFYPSASLSFLPSQLFEGLKTNYKVDLLKFRIGYGTSAGFPPLYVTENVLSANSRAYVQRDGTVVPSNSVSYFLGNPNLTPELHAETEFGLEFALFNNRLGADFTIYSKQTKDLITEATLDPATGYQRTYVNIGKMSNNGIELEMNGTPVKTGHFDWTISAIFTKYKSTIDELGGGLDKVLINGFTDLGNYAIAGEPFGVMYGHKIKTDSQGRRLVDGNGYYLQSDEPDIIGNPHPDFELTVINTLKYKGFTFNMQWDYRQGGDIYSETVNTLLGRGISKDTDFDRSQSFVMPGYLEDGTVNTKQITATNAYFNNFGSQAPSEVNVIDGTTIRLREISLSYSLPKKWIEKSPFGRVDFSILGQNIWFKAVNFPKYMNFDTDMLSLGVGNGLGFDFITGPSSTKYGASLKVTF
ncbi:MAG TPA: SusC/RagA family TonB-linked outer membrane protein [Marinilabiliales bacterium]|nr:SusC/RagA family TonB-linked outer membrane protein [Marinilabiliales bacterium]HBO73124.1 SusC/RagA family TonB-linked outer membrane protein [Marinilabiliales bacterium]HBX84154.1 SusC/RagA family TonB-linked outer membrane protein [Marinilabiliales bacterium]HBY53796.1 SusC/RagA family TonB-linked outer membrane protein [Marinilabiliales bacterium]